MNEKRITLQSTDLGDFRGRTTKIKYNPGINRFFGRNGSGKTTLFDAHTWIFFGKNSLGKIDFDIKTIQSGEPVSGSEHSVRNHYLINGESFDFQRIYKEVWQKKRGAMNAIKTGNTTVYKVAGKKDTKKKYDALIADLLQPIGIDQSLLDSDITPTEIYKIVTDPKHFASLHWTIRRKILGQMDGVEIDKQAIIDNVGLRPYLAKSQVDDVVIEYTVEEKQQIAEDRQKEINESLKEFKGKVEEHETILRNAGDQPERISLEEAKRKVVFAGNAVDKANQAIENFKTGDNSDAIEQLKKLNADLYRLENDFNSEKIKAQSELDRQNREFEKLKSNLNRLENELTDAEENLARVRVEYQSQKDKIDDIRMQAPPADKTVCFNCGQPLPENMIHDSREKYNLRKADILKAGDAKLKEIAFRGSDIKQKRDDLNSKITELENLISEFKIEKPEILDQSTTPEIVKLKTKIAELKNQTQDQNQLPPELVIGLEKARQELSKAQQVEADLKAVEFSRSRIEELQREKTELSNEFNDLEKLLDLIGEYNRQVAEQTETIVNQMFSGNVSFRMFRRLENGNLESCCDILMDGKPYDGALSTGEKVSAGLRIIKTMSKHFKLWAPVFIENAESVSVIPEMECQTIELHHDLKVETLTQE